MCRNGQRLEEHVPNNRRWWVRNRENWCIQLTRFHCHFAFFFFPTVSSCPVDNSIFPGFTPDGNALQSIYEAFRFTESYGVIFQCNVKYCLGPCEPAVCEWGRDSMESWGRKRRSVGNETMESDDEMNISQEILVLDFGDEHNRDFLRSDPSTDFGKGNQR